MSEIGPPRGIRPPPPPTNDDYLPPSPRRSGCLTAFMVIVGVILLLPGVCALIFFTSSGSEPVVTGLVTLGLLVAVGGIFLIWAAIRGPRA
jgi:uncharacterized membrane protein HdeD (DUF308 family)